VFSVVVVVVVVVLIHCRAKKRTTLFLQ